MLFPDSLVLDLVQTFISDSAVEIRFERCMYGNGMVGIIEVNKKILDCIPGGIQVVEVSVGEYNQLRVVLFKNMPEDNFTSGF